MNPNPRAKGTSGSPPNSIRPLSWVIVLAGVTGMAMGGYWLVAWLSGAATTRGEAGILTMKTNMALGQMLAGAALVAVGFAEPGKVRRRVGVATASLVLLIGVLTLSEHLFGYDMGIDQLLAREAPGAPATASPNRIGVPGSASLFIFGAGFLGLVWRQRWAGYMGVAMCFINIVPLVGFLYTIEEFYGQPRVPSMGIAWPSVVALICLGLGLASAQVESGPMAMLRRNDAGGALLRGLLPAVILVPLVLGFLRVRGQRWGWYDTEAGTGIMILALIAIFMGLLWHSALQLSQSALAQGRAEAERRRSEQTLLQLVERSPFGTYLVDGRLRITQMNASSQTGAFRNVTSVIGRPLEEALRILWPEAVALEVAGRFRHTLESGEPFYSRDFVRPRSDVEGIQAYEWEVHRVTLTDGQHGVVCYYYDSTKLREAEAVLKRSNEQLEQLVAERTAKLQEMVGELEHFSYTITHDMRAPLRAMRSYAEIMTDSRGDCAATDERDFLGRIITAADRMDMIIRDALTFSKAVKDELPLMPVDLGKLLRGMLDTYPELDGAAIRIESAIPPVMGNEAGLTQCFSNLLGNAVKFVRSGRKAEVRVSSELVQNLSKIQSPTPKAQGHNGDGHIVRIWVEDKGPGIPKELLPRLFEMFSRGSSPQAGTGMGLALVRKVVERMGGRVGVESDGENGSRFWLELQPVDTDAESCAIMAGQTISSCDHAQT
ncbi:MAG TPA: ATP-binding protein [Candidatus Dormibacteraeota bacterium]|nr:ATP-binding protein [Candidatus Dormibacteraeota bacterium]